MKRTREELDKAAEDYNVLQQHLQQQEDDHHEEARRESTKGDRRNRKVGRSECPYLFTINRQVLDSDMERFCSVSLSTINVYACLVCGKYFQGRGRHSHAYTHSLDALHHIFINLLTQKVYCLPDGYEIDDPSLDDIRHVLHPRFTVRQVRVLDSPDCTLPGMVGLDNIKETDFVNVTIQSLMRVTLLRDFFLIPENYQACKSVLVHRFGELTRKIWHPQNYKGQVSPHLFLQAVMASSKERFRIGLQSDPVEFTSWLLNTLHVDLGGTKKPNSSVIYRCFQGELEVTTEFQSRKTIDRKQDSDMSEEKSVAGNLERETSKVPFLMLGLDFPLFNEVMEEKLIPQVPLSNILKKFDGDSITEVVRSQGIARMRYRVTRLPPYLILHFRRFTKNDFFIEKNITLVDFPVKDLELKSYIPLPESERLRSKYDLVANTVHDGKLEDGSYRVFTHKKSENLWYEMQDLHVAKVHPQVVVVSEAYVQIYEQQQGRS